MNTRILVNVSLLALILVLAWYLTATGPRDPEPAPVFLAGINPGSVTKIRLSRKGMPDMEFMRSPSGWRIIEPVEIPANPDRIRPILGLPNTPSRARLDPGLNDIRAFGFDPPSVMLALDNEVFHFGDENPFDNSRYVLYEGTVHVIGGNLYPLLLQPVEFFACDRATEPVRDHPRQAP